MSAITARPGPRQVSPGPISSDGAFAPAVLQRVLAAASRAPSLHNTQPWNWRLVGQNLELRADRSRQLSVADPDGHSLMVSCGAALALTELAFAVEGWQLRTDRLPSRDDPDLLARFTSLGRYQSTKDDRNRLAASERRHSERRPFLAREVPAELVEALRAAADRPGVHTHFPTRAQEKVNLAVAVSQADRVEREDAAYQAEMARWLHDTDVHTDGVPTTAVPHVRAGSPRHTDIPLRDFEVGISGRDLIQSDIDEQPLIAVVLTTSDTPGEQLAAGEAMMRLMLAAQDAGLASCPLSQAVDLIAFRSQLQTSMGWRGYPQMMLRLGYREPASARPARTPRRPVADLLDVSAP